MGQLLSELTDRSAEEILEALLSAWKSHIGSATVADDTTLVILKRNTTP
jgi:serine phosphatase RsbU (regulator of sigma subunit)